MIRGIAGPGAPHLFEFDRRESLGTWAVKFEVFSKSVFRVFCCNVDILKLLAVNISLKTV